MGKDYNQLSQSARLWNEEIDPMRWEVSYYKKGNHLSHKLRSREKKVLQYLDDLKLKKGSKVLELGYGAGVTSSKIYKRGFNIIGVDISHTLCELAIKNCKKVKDKRNKAKFKFLVGNAEKLKFPDNSFNCVVGLGFLQYLEYPDSCIKETKRVLKPGGYFIITQRNMYGISSLDGPIKLVRALMFILTKRRYELRWQDTFFIEPILLFSTLLSPFSGPMKELRTRLLNHKKTGKTKKIALSFDRLKKLIEDSNFKIIRYDGAGYLTKKRIFFPKLARELNRYLQNANDTKRIQGIYKFGNSVVFLAQKKPQ